MTFKESVYQFVSQIPNGKVATYGQIASMIGNPRAARQVGFMLRGLGIEEKEIPWWRVINRQGYISINHGNGGVEKQIQRDLLKDEGIEVSEDYIVDLHIHLWDGQ